MDMAKQPKKANKEAKAQQKRDKKKQKEPRPQKANKERQRFNTVSGDKVRVRGTKRASDQSFTVEVSIEAEADSFYDAVDFIERADAAAPGSALLPMIAKELDGFDIIPQEIATGAELEDEDTVRLANPFFAKVDMTNPDMPVRMLCAFSKEESTGELTELCVTFSTNEIRSSYRPNKGGETVIVVGTGYFHNRRKIPNPTNSSALDSVVY